MRASHDSGEIERPIGRGPWVAGAWRALVGLTLAAAEASRADVPQLAETVATGRDSAAPMAV
jgi:hypothetical protein